MLSSSKTEEVWRIVSFSSLQIDKKIDGLLQLQLPQQLHYTTTTTTNANILRYITLHQLHYTTLITLHYTNCITLHCITLITLQLQQQLLPLLKLRYELQYITLNYSNCTAVCRNYKYKKCSYNSTALHYTALITLHYATATNTNTNTTALHFATLHYTTPITLHYTTTKTATATTSISTTTVHYNTLH